VQGRFVPVPFAGVFGGVSEVCPRHVTNAVHHQQVSDLTGWNAVSAIDRSLPAQSLCVQ
jgi:hypothetical protein